MAATIPGYAPQRQMLPLMRSLISSSERLKSRTRVRRFSVTWLASPFLASCSSATAEQICPGVQ